MLRQTIQEYLSLLNSEIPAGDEVMIRLYPPASLDDPSVEETYRDLVHSELENHKKTTALTALSTLNGPEWNGPLDEGQQEAWLVLLTDLRLAIGVRLRVTKESMDEESDWADPEKVPLAIMHYLGSLQQSLVETLDPQQSNGDPFED